MLGSAGRGGLVGKWGGEAHSRKRPVCENFLDWGGRRPLRPDHREGRGQQAW